MKPEQNSVLNAGTGSRRRPLPHRRYLILLMAMLLFRRLTPNRYGKTMGIIGFGRIGRTTGRIAKSMGMEILATGSRPVPEGEEIASYVNLDELLERSDVIALHCPLFPETRGIINKDTISKMKDGVIIINNSRGQLIVEQDLADALNSGKVYAAGLDVVSEEPVREDNPLLSAKNCLITPHISWASKEARKRLIDISALNLEMYLKGTPVNTVI